MFAAADVGAAIRHRKRPPGPPAGQVLARTAWGMS